MQTDANHPNVLIDIIGEIPVDTNAIAVVKLVLNTAVAVLF